MDFNYYPNEEFSLSSEDFFANLGVVNNCSSEECADIAGLNDLLSHQTIEGDENSEWLSVFVEDCFSGPGDHNLAAGNEQLIAKTSSLSKPVETLKPQLLLKTATMKESEKHSEKPTRKKRKTISLMKLETQENPSIVELEKYNFTPDKIKPDPDSPLLQQAHWLADSELILPVNRNPCAKEDSCEENMVLNVDVSPSSELGSEPVSKTKKNETKVLRRCSHCETVKTPLWRPGPLGKGTLCNACGVRWLKCGNLFPEYRPANSPTFVSNMHSNVLRQVLKMREVAHQSASADMLTNLDHRDEGADNSDPNRSLSQQLIEIGDDTRYSSEVVDDCFSSCGDYKLAPAKEVITQISIPNLQGSPVRNPVTLKVPTVKRKRTATVRKPKTHKKTTKHGLISPELRPSPDTLRLEQAHWLFDSNISKLHNPSPVKNRGTSEGSTIKQKRRPISVAQPKLHKPASNLGPAYLNINPKVELKTHKITSNLGLNRIISPKLEPDCDPILLEEPYWSCDSKLIRSTKLTSSAKNELCAEERELGCVVSPKSDEKEIVSKPRRCSHCETEKTPQWRQGPSGKGTLCNACGLVWLKSGNLFPEYRPANSPTFVSSLQSNVQRHVRKIREARLYSGAVE